MFPLARALPQALVAELRPLVMENRTNMFEFELARIVIWGIKFILLLRIASRWGDCLFASKVFISDLSHGSLSSINPSAPDSDPNSRPLVSKPVIGDNMWLGENICVLSGRWL